MTVKFSRLISEFVTSKPPLPEYSEFTGFLIYTYDVINYPVKDETGLSNTFFALTGGINHFEA